MNEIAKKLLLTLVCLVFLAVAVIGFLVWRDQRPRKHVFPVPSDGVLTEALAVQLTQQTLARENLDTNNFTAYAWGTRTFQGKPEQLLARNTLNPNRGYVLWKRNGDAATWTYSVSVEKHGSEAVCQAFRGK